MTQTRLLHIIIAVVVQEESIRSATVLNAIPGASQRAIPSIYCHVIRPNANVTPFKSGGWLDEGGPRR